MRTRRSRKAAEKQADGAAGEAGEAREGAERGDGQQEQEEQEEPKKMSLFDDAEEEEEEGDGVLTDEFDVRGDGEEGDGEEDEEAAAEEEREAEEEMQRMTKQGEYMSLKEAAGRVGAEEEEDEDDEDDEQDDRRLRVEMSEISAEELKRRIDGIVEVLGDFAKRKEEGRSRSEYVDMLAGHLVHYYGYLRELIDLFLDMFSPSECVEFLEANDRPRPMTIRVNTLKTRRKDLIAALMKRGVQLEPLAKWSKVGVKVMDSPVPIGATPEYLTGLYMRQSAASLTPVMALAPQPNEHVLDMASAPGGKTSHIAQLMKNQGVLVANDLKRERQKATVANLHRLGVRNAIVCCQDGRSFPGILKGFDRVLLDAPCSGLGIVARDETVKMQRSMQDVRRVAQLQRELLRAAVDCVSAKSKTGRIIVYSTCSVSVEENEAVIDYILKTRNVRVVPTGLQHGTPGWTRYRNHRFHPSIAQTRRFFPHVHNMDGFYVAKLEKLADGRPGDTAEAAAAAATNDSARDIATATAEELAEAAGGTSDDGDHPDDTFDAAAADKDSDAVAAKAPLAGKSAFDEELEARIEEERELARTGGEKLSEKALRRRAKKALRKDKQEREAAAAAVDAQITEIKDDDDVDEAEEQEEEEDEEDEEDGEVEEARDDGEEEEEKAEQEQEAAKKKTPESRKRSRSVETERKLREALEKARHDEEGFFDYDADAAANGKDTADAEEEENEEEDEEEEGNFVEVPVTTWRTRRPRLIPTMLPELRPQLVYHFRHSVEQGRSARKRRRRQSEAASVAAPSGRNNGQKTQNGAARRASSGAR